ncbi:calcium-dependent mitochondrial ATP-magnesium/phosphate carrier protein 1-like [Vicia villosa]|uniref:calcium-dependent mitochondrial ATP-magnesium/phosphate carrier protein 1-like n=1 Tax=Vicia villosa TaxID=3911 RepID=UPI00273C446F|nr:calcium-dependent mitochondrial ATP-magnesium/phosphate carrier protein 1-like [Vicia villosa]
MLKNVIGDDQANKSDIGTVGKLLAGGVAGRFMQTAIYLLDLIETRLHTCASEVEELLILEQSQRIYAFKTEGPRAFNRGLLPSVIGMISYAGVDLAVYDTLKDMSRRCIIHNNDSGPLIQLGCGTISGTLGTTCVFPLQVIRTRYSFASKLFLPEWNDPDQE